MKRFTLAVLSAPFLTAAWVGPTGAASLAEIKQRGYMVAAVSAEASPFGLIADGKPDGFDAQLLDKLRQAAPFEIRVRVVPPTELSASLADGRADMIASSLEITQNRQKLVDFSAPLAESTIYFLTRKNDEQIKSIADLGGRPFGVLSGSAGFLALTELEHRLAKAEVRLGEAVEFDTPEQTYRGLASGKVDYVVNDFPDLEAAQRKEPGAFAIGQPVAHKSYVAWSVAKGNRDLAAFLKSFMLRERANGDLAGLQRQWLGRTYTGLPETITAEDWWTAREDKPTVLPIAKRTDPD